MVHRDPSSAPPLLRRTPETSTVDVAVPSFVAADTVVSVEVVMLGAVCDRWLLFS